jgi:putative transposase
MLKAFKYLLKPTDEQKVLINKNIGNNRWIYNWALDRKIKHWEEEKKKSSEEEKEYLSAFYQLARELPALKKAEETQWLSEGMSLSYIHTLQHVDKAYENFFRRIKNQEKGGYPRFKGKYSRQSFTDKPQAIDFDKNAIKLPKLGWTYARFHREFEGTMKTFTITRETTGKYFISIIVENGKELPSKREVTTMLGIDKGTHNLVSTSEGERIENPRFTLQGAKKIAKLNRNLARKQKQSGGWVKARLKLSKAHERIANQRTDFIHNLSHQLVQKDYDAFVIENFDVKNLVQQAYKAQSILDAGFGVLTQQLEYKADWQGKTVVKLDKSEKTTKTCSNCHKPNENVKWWWKQWECQYCHHLNIKGIDNVKTILQKGKEKIKKESKPQS